MKYLYASEIQKQNNGYLMTVVVEYHPSWWKRILGYTPIKDTVVFFTEQGYVWYSFPAFKRVRSIGWFYLSEWLHNEFECLLLSEKWTEEIEL